MSTPYITILSGHFPKEIEYVRKTKELVEEYCSIHGYNFYYEESEPLETEEHALHFRRSWICQQAAEKFPNTEWFLWLDSDVYVNPNNKNKPITSFIDLSDPNILYHTFHEAPWGRYPINTGVKFVHKNTLELEKIVWGLRNEAPWNTFPYEQKTIYEYMFPRIPGRYIIHDPHTLNCIVKAYPEHVKYALFVHMCGSSREERDEHMKMVSSGEIHSPKKTIGYIHVCQKDGWERSFEMILNEVKRSGLYDKTDEIRCVIVNDIDRPYYDEAFEDAKIKLLYAGESQKYERPALLHMRGQSEKEYCNYWYTHTKGLRWFNTPKENNVVDWINLLIYWNITKWEEAISNLKTHDVYGCNFTETPAPHFSGNFWWATSEYVRKLPAFIASGYNDPEFWLFLGNPGYKNVFSSGLEGMGHYDNRFERNKYAPDADFALMEEKPLVESGTLASLVDNTKTDKNTTHSYLDLYEDILKEKKYSAKNIIEIGIGDFGEKNGGSIKMWRDYFPNATVFGVDILTKDRVMDELLEDERVVIFTETDGYNIDFVNREINNIKFDFAIDDGPHTLESMVQFVRLYHTILADDGVLIVEDIPQLEWLEILAKEIPQDMIHCVQGYDLRSVKNRFDDIVFVFDKRCVNTQE